MEEKRKQIQQYLESNINPIVEPMLELLAKQMPEQPLKWMETYIHKLISQKGNQTFGQSSDQEEDQQEFKKKMERLKNKNTKKMSRQGISAQVFGKFNQKSEFKPRMIQKDPTTCLLLKTLLQKSILFTNLSQDDLSLIVQATQEINTTVGQKIITQGDQGDSLFIVFSGEYDCWKIIAGKNTYLKTYITGQAFGELALMYNSPRAASIICKTAGKIFALDRQTFKNVVQQAATKKRKHYSEIISKVEILSEVDAYQRQQLCDSLKEQCYDANQYIVKQGDSGDRFYMVAEGCLIAEKVEIGSTQPKIVFEYKAGDYFGEIALIQNTVRQASIKTTTPCKIVWIDRNTFKRQLGPIQNILSRNMEKYKKYLGH